MVRVWFSVNNKNDVVHMLDFDVETRDCGEIEACKKYHVTKIWGSLEFPTNGKYKFTMPGFFG